MPFVKGDKNINRSGRPKGAISILPLLRDKLFALALRRMKRDPELQDVDTNTLIKFISANLPKDMSLSLQRPQEINYISQVPRPIDNIEYIPINDSKDNTGLEEKKTQVIEIQQVEKIG